MLDACALLLLPFCEKTASSLPDTTKLFEAMTHPDSPHLIHPEATLNLWSRISGNPAGTASIRRRETYLVSQIYSLVLPYRRRVAEGRD